MAIRRPPRDSDVPSDPQRAYTLAVRLLARRDYASGELQARLEAGGYDAPAAATVLSELAQRGFLNDARYAANYVIWHCGRGQGPVRIAADLRMRGVGPELIVAALAQVTDWPARAQAARRAKFGAKSPATWAEKARQARFLQYRGFSADHIRSATGAELDVD